ncbi:hypothetical protein C5748_10925 [Phyllobacterium phragmitis]|uniref:Uncharacterized protein n=1 Tax=Phyllobacterium phragmitis TaxID=2670329 RepID=A0A2S9IT85_9HYPH|nr:hypothetical protein [Phyllobacterium phragmitis]PRD43743.1 hypothetical protein C5748_10925 [Phyllobacterium phragmitis]
MSDQTKEIESTLLRLAHHYEKANDLFKAVRKAHPEASRKQIVLAALSAMIDRCETNDTVTKKLHTLAVRERGVE